MYLLLLFNQINSIIHILRTIRSQLYLKETFVYFLLYLFIAGFFTALQDAQHFQSTGGKNDNIVIEVTKLMARTITS